MRLTNLFRHISVRAISIGLTLSLMIASTPAAPQTIVAVAKESSVSFLFWLHSSGLAKLTQDRDGGEAKEQEKQADRDVKVSRIQIFPGDVTIDLDDHVRFSAVAYDQSGNPVGGVKIKWSGQALLPTARIRLSPFGEFEGLTPGTFNVMAEANGKTAQVVVIVRPGVRRNLNLITITRQVSSRDVPTTRVASVVRPAQQSPAARSSRRRNRIAPTKRSHAGSSTPAVPFFVDDGWGDSNYWSADDPGNGVGNPPGAPLDGGAGSGNSQFVAPVYGSAGRGINISLAASYNGRLWNKAGTQIAYDNDRGWPAPGFNLGFGKILGMGVLNGGMLVDADGTRHGYTGSITGDPSWGTHGLMHTTDGSFIDYTYWTGTGGGITNAQAKLPNGTVINYGAPGPGAVYPTSIEDANGNYITITYVNNAGPQIQTINDTLNRTISFYYDSNNLLTAITAPGLDGVSRTLVRFHYHQLSLNYSFSGLTPSVRDSNPWVVDAIYYPATGTGYWLNDSDSYSTYGMLRRVSERRNMTFQGPDPVPPIQGPTEQGTITSAGSITREELYNYPAYVGDPDPNVTQSSSLTDAPTYTTMTESWTRDGTNVDSATTGYLVAANATNPDQPTIPSRKVEVTLPNQTKSVQYSYNYTSLPENDPRKALDGLVYQDQTLDSTGTVLQGSTSTWEKGAYDAPRPLRVEKTNENQQMTAADFIYGSVYNQVIDVRDYDYGSSVLLRSTRTQYQNSVNYTGYSTSQGYVGRHIFNLPLSVEVYASDNVSRVSRTEYQYDGQTLTPAPNVVQHDQASNPYADAEGYCYLDNDWSDGDCNGSCLPNCPECIQDPSCDGYCPQIYYCPYNSATDYRGNVTQVTSYADAINLTSAVTEMARYDITGNVVTTITGCCQEASFNYSVDTQYAYPLAQTRGSDTDPYKQVTSSATYDFNTALTRFATDPNGRVSETTYDSATLRPTTVILPTGAHTDYSYGDVAMTVTSTTYFAISEGAGIADQNVKYLNGRGEVRLERARGPDDGVNQTWDVVDTIYNNMSQVYQQSWPYRLGAESPHFLTATYDALGRISIVTMADGSEMRTFYNEGTRPSVASSAPGETTRTRDAWGRERWSRTNASGQIVEIVEPDPLGDGSVASNGMVTTYGYDTLGHLEMISQGGQTRSFKHDSIGRLTAQKLAEMDATINDSGTYVGIGGSGAQWSDYFRYENAHSNMVQRLDARGVKTNYWYFNSAGHTDPGDGTSPDPLNRLQSVSWDTSVANQNLQPTDPSYVLSAATVSYQYRDRATNSTCDPLDPSGRKDVTQLASVSSSGISTESHCYDSEARITSKTLTLNSRPLYPFQTDYSYDSLDRVINVTYPAEYLNGGGRKIVHHDYDNSSRLSSLTYDGQSFASNIVYNAVSQTTFLNIGSGANQIEERYNYDSQTGLLGSQTVAKSLTPTNYLLNLEYQYTNSSGKRTGQLTKILNNLNHQKDRGYSYDALGRLKEGTGGPSASVLWTQTYSYDRYGNRLTVSASGYSAANKSAAQNQQSEIAKRAVSEPREVGVATGSITQPTDPRVVLPTDLLAKNDLDSMTRGTNRTVREGSESLSDSSTSLYKPASKATATAPTDPPTFTNNPLAAGVEVKAIHITELRAAINALRARLGMSAYSWSESIAAGVYIKAAHILEMRTALDQTLGAPSPSYAAGLAQGQPILAVHIQELRDRVIAGWTASSQIPRDGHASLSYDVASNRITTSGFDYDKSGNQVRALIPGGTGSQRYQYDAANRLVKVKADDNQTVIASYTYGTDNQRLIAEEAGERTYCVAEGLSVVAEYIENGGSTIPSWSKSYVYLGTRLLSTLTPNGSGGESIEYHHPDRLGTRLVTNPSTGTSFEQVTLPFGTGLTAESTGATNRRFTSYDRSETTRLDYAVNRHYDSQQGRFTQVDPAGMGMSNLEAPQTLNLYSYCTNDPINRTDPNGLGFLSFLRSVFKVINKVLKWIAIIVVIALVVVIAFNVLSLPGAQFLSNLFWNAVDLVFKWLAKAGIMHFAEGAATVGARAIIIGAVGAGLEVVNALAGQAKDPPGKTIRRQQKEIRRQERAKRFPRVRIPGGKEVDPHPKPPQGIPETKPPSPPDPVRINPNPEKVRLPENASRWVRFKLGLALVLRGLGNYLSHVVIMVDPEALAEIACEEDPSSEMCRQFQIYLPPEKRCKFLRCA